MFEGVYKLPLTSQLLAALFIIKHVPLTSYYHVFFQFPALRRVNHWLRHLPLTLGAVGRILG